MKSSTLRRGGATAFISIAIITTLAAPAFAAVNFLLATPTPNVGTLHNELHSVAVGSPTVMFAVGEYFNGTWDHALILKGNGSTWSVSSPKIPAKSTHDSLNAVAMVNASVGYAVGTYSVGKSSFNLVEKYAGGAWSLVTVANPLGIASSEFTGVATGSATSIMAVGGNHPALKPIRPIAVLFNGKTWKYTVVPNPGKSGTTYHTAELSSVAVVPGSAGKKFWAVGTYSNGHDTIPFFDLWNGLSWKQYGLAQSVQTVTKAPTPVSSVISSVAVISSNNAWAVGFFTDNHKAPIASNNRTFTAHWNGVNWSMIASPDRVSIATPNELSAVSARGANAIYAVGRYFAGPFDQTQALQWSAATKTWVKITSGNNTTNHNSLEGIAMIPVKGAVAVGTYYNGKSDRTLVDVCKDC